MDFDIIVVGAGHAGIEAAYSSAKMGKKVLLITMNYDTIAQMSCNPSIGGISKGNIVKEIDAFEGLMPKIADKTAIQFRMLNTKKGPAVQALRVQSDKFKYSEMMKFELTNTENIFVYQDTVQNLIVKNNKVIGVKTERQLDIYAQAVILTTGTFLRGKIYIGDYIGSGGRIGEKPSTILSESLKNNGFELFRFKTGTPARVNKRSIDFSKLEIQNGDPIGKFFSLNSIIKNIKTLPQLPCYIARTNKNTHKMILTNINNLPLYSGKISGIGPRYCPSFEDKVIKFKDKNYHLIFVEPEGLDTNLYYLNGFSTSLTETLQPDLYRSVEGLESIEIIKPAYAIEYDAINPTQLNKNLEAKHIENLFFAGQINGTSGYEEAAGQGLIAGINAALKVDRKEPFIIKREESYIGVMIDDLTTKGVDEPYRMFTSRAEYRLNLRFDNTYFRLSHYAKNFGLLSEDYIKYIEDMKQKFNIYIEKINEIKVKDKNNKNTSIDLLIKRNEYTIDDLKEKFPELHQDLIESIFIETKYKGYIDKEKSMIKNSLKYKKYLIPDNINYKDIGNLSIETIERLNKIRPKSIYELEKIIGIKPTDVLSIINFIAKKYKKQ